MITKRLQKQDIAEAAALLQAGRVVAFPTDTVYGLGVIYENEQALQALKESKGRPDSKPIPTMVGNLEQMLSIADMSEAAIALAKAFMPGAFTMIVKRKDRVPAYLTNGFDTVGIRMPDDPFVLELINRCGKPLLVTSANMSGQETGTVDEQVLAQLDGRIDAIVMGEAAGKVASTIVDFSGDEVRIVREGPIREEDIQNVLQNR